MTDHDAKLLDGIKCPHCGSGDFNAQVLAWAIYRAGQYETLDLHEAIEVSEGDTIAVCAAEACGREFYIDRTDQRIEVRKGIEDA